MASIHPKNLQVIGDYLAILWSDDSESFIPIERLRAFSPSADNMGEKDLLGKQFGGDGPKEFPGVTLVSWQPVGSYATLFSFSDGHRTGIYSHDYLYQIGQKFS